MSIQKWYAVVCDNCGQIIQYWEVQLRKESNRTFQGYKQAQEV